MALGYTADTDACLGETKLANLISTMPPNADVSSRLSKVGIVSIEHPAIRTPSTTVDVGAPSLGKLIDMMLRRMKAADGIGLAANQLAVPARVLVHGLSKLAPTALINPVLVSTSGEWAFHEGCLSLKLEGASAKVARARSVVMAASVLGGKQVLIEADEYLARVLQHEFDHINGVEYIQRLTGGERERVYSLLRRARVDVDLFPPIRS